MPFGDADLADLYARYGPVVFRHARHRGPATGF